MFWLKVNEIQEEPQYFIRTRHTRIKYRGRKRHVCVFPFPLLLFPDKYSKTLLIIKTRRWKFIWLLCTPVQLYFDVIGYFGCLRVERSTLKPLTRLCMFCAKSWQKLMILICILKFILSFVGYEDHLGNYSWVCNKVTLLFCIKNSQKLFVKIFKCQNDI